MQFIFCVYQIKGNSFRVDNGSKFCSQTFHLSNRIVQIGYRFISSTLTLQIPEPFFNLARAHRELAFQDSMKTPSATFLLNVCKY